jgi:hypothetical protein
MGEAQRCKHQRQPTPAELNAAGMNRKERRARRVGDAPSARCQPTKAERERIADQIETVGCSCCGMRFAAGIPYLVARTKAGWVGRCTRPDCNADFLPDSPLFIGTGVFASDPWTENDRDWFRANPNRCWRLRWPMPGEIETLATDEHLTEQADASWPVSDCARDAITRRDEGATIAIAVHQFEPGKRLRIPFEFVSQDPLESFTDAGIPALMPFLAEIVARHRAAMPLVGTQAAVDARLQRRFEAMAKLVRGGAL